MRFEIDIAKNGCDLLPLECVRGGNESERRNDYFTVKTESANGYFQSDRRIAHGDAVLNADEICDSLFKFPFVGAHVREPLRIENLIKALKQTFAVTDIGSTHVQFFG